MPSSWSFYCIFSSSIIPHMTFSFVSLAAIGISLYVYVCSLNRPLAYVDRAWKLKPLNILLNKSVTEFCFSTGDIANCLIDSAWPIYHITHKAYFWARSHIVEIMLSNLKEQLLFCRSQCRLHELYYVLNSFSNRILILRYLEKFEKSQFWFILNYCLRWYLTNCICVEKTAFVHETNIII